MTEEKDIKDIESAEKTESAENVEDTEATQTEETPQEAPEAEKEEEEKDPLEKALDILKEGSGVQFDPKVVEVFIDSLPEVEKVLRKYNPDA